MALSAASPDSQSSGFSTDSLEGIGGIGLFGAVGCASLLLSTGAFSTVSSPLSPVPGDSSKAQAGSQVVSRPMRDYSRRPLQTGGISRHATQASSPAAALLTLAGASARAIAATVCYPLDTIKTRLQVGPALVEYRREILAHSQASIAVDRNLRHQQGGSKNIGSRKTRSPSSETNPDLSPIPTFPPSSAPFRSISIYFLLLLLHLHLLPPLPPAPPAATGLLIQPTTRCLALGG